MDCKRHGSWFVLFRTIARKATLLRTVFVVRSPSPDAADSLRKALERNLDWIKAHIPALASDSPTGARDTQPYIDWIYERLKDRISPDLEPQEIDRMVRGEVWKVFHGRRSRQPHISRFADVEKIGDPEDQSALDFEQALETADEVRACLECLPEEVRQLVIEAYTLTEGDLSSPGIRERLAKNLGISRNAVDQRLSRAIRSIRERMRKDPGSETT
jgi:hypothetical protein